MLSRRGSVSWDGFRSTLSPQGLPVAGTRARADGGHGVLRISLAGVSMETPPMNRGLQENRSFWSLFARADALGSAAQSHDGSA